MAFNEEGLPHASGRAEPSAKRRRIGLACNACRTRKSRCDGQRPTCSACQSLEYECQYEPSESSTNVIVRKEYVSDLVNRLTSVERLLQRHDDLLKGHLSACASLDVAPTTTASVSQPDSASENRAEDNLDLHASALEEPGTEESRTDGLAMTFVEESTSTYFGESSNIHFTRLLLRAIAAVRKSPPAVQAVVENEYTLVEKSLATFSQESPSAVENFATESHASLKILPSTEKMDSMLNIFFRSTGLLFPFIHEATMRETYSQCVVGGFTRVRRTWLGTLNMIFAMASISGQTDVTSAKMSLERSSLFYRKAMGLCGEVSKHVISLEVVHYLLLVVLYCQGTQRSVQAWNLHGLLVRSAMALGLHADRTHNPPDGCRQESGRRTWLTIYCLDKVLSMTFGRPAAIPEDYMIPRLPAPWPSSITSMASDNSDDLPREFLSVSVGLYEIMGHSLVRQYGANVGRSDLELDEMSIFQASGKLRRLLRKWVTSLPSHLQLCLPGAPEVTEKSQANKLRVILTLKYHNVNILIHRPLLSTALRYMFAGDTPVTPHPPYQVQLAMAEAQECVTAAELTIDIVHSILVVDQTASNNLGVWFFTLYYVFTASLVISARLLWAQHGTGAADQTTVAHYKGFLQKANAIFHKLDSENDLIMSCARYIRYLSQLCDTKVPIGSSEMQGHVLTPVALTLAGSGFHERNGDVSTGTQGPDLMGLNVDTLDLFSAEFLDPSVFDGFAANAGDHGFASSFLSG